MMCKCRGKSCIITFTTKELTTINFYFQKIACPKCQINHAVSKHLLRKTNYFARQLVTLKYKNTLTKLYTQSQRLEFCKYIRFQIFTFSESLIQLPRNSTEVTLTGFDSSSQENYGTKNTKTKTSNFMSKKKKKKRLPTANSSVTFFTTHSK